MAELSRAYGPEDDGMRDARTDLTRRKVELYERLIAAELAEPGSTSNDINGGSHDLIRSRPPNRWRQRMSEETAHE